MRIEVVEKSENEEKRKLQTCKVDPSGFGKMFGFGRYYPLDFNEVILRSNQGKLFSDVLLTAISQNINKKFNDSGVQEARL